jgi:hypothetical protein
MSEEISQQQQQQRAVIPHIEVVNEIQIVVSNKKDNLPRSSVNVATPNDSKDIRRCVSSRSSKTDITVTTPTTATLDTTTKQVTTKNERRTSKGEREKSDSGSNICVCGKLIKRVKELLEAKETKAKSEFSLSLCYSYYILRQHASLLGLFAHDMLALNSQYFNLNGGGETFHASLD